MKFLYSIAIYLYGFMLSVVALFNSRARKLVCGQRSALTLLREGIELGASYVWVHAASLGEFEQGRPLIEKIKEENPDLKILLTFYSPSGYEVRKNYEQADLVCYLPLDTPCKAKEFVEIAKPKCAIFIKYEFWPNFLIALEQAKVPTYLIAAIFRPNQLFFKPYGKSYLALLKTYRHIFVQDEESALLLEKFGINQLSVSGDTRFDRVLAQAQMATGNQIVEEFVDGKTAFVLGSSWAKDEGLFAEYLKQNKTLKLIIAPHEIHEAHISEIEGLFNGDCVRYTKAEKSLLKEQNCLIIDTIGLLSSIYCYGKIAYIGGGFGVGIHNILEAAVYGLPVVFGPNYTKFREACELVNLGGGFSIKNYNELKQILGDLLTDGERAGKIAGNYVLENAGATEQIMKVISF